jgi:hypothetical protein
MAKAIERSGAWWRRRTRTGKVLLATVAGLLAIMSTGSIISPQSESATQVPVGKVANTAIPIFPQGSPTPIRGASSLRELPAQLEALLPEAGQGRVREFQGWVEVVYKSDPLGEDAMKRAARRAARDFILAAYATGLPLKGVQFTAGRPDGSLGLAVTLGADVARTHPPGKWGSRSDDPTAFVAWMREEARLGELQESEDRAFIGGPWAE